MKQKDQSTPHDPANSHFDSLGNRDWTTKYYGDVHPPFIPGVELCEVFFREQVEPIIREYAPNLQFAAGRLDYGSDVLGYDTELSRDHAWGPQVTLYLSEEDFSLHREKLDAVLQEKLPLECCGYSTRASRDWVWHPTRNGEGHHRVRFETVRSFFQSEIGLVPSASMSAAEWLSLPAQKLRVYAAGTIFRDDSQELSEARNSIRWYPDDLWRHVMACQWQKLNDRAPFAGRCAHVGDDWGSADNSSETMRNLVYAAFLLEKRYAPYTKWLGTALKELSVGEALIELAHQERVASSWPEREDAVVKAYQVVGDLHNRTEGLPPISTESTTFYSRPYRMINTEAIVRSLKDSIRSPEIAALSFAECAVWQMVGYDTALCNPKLYSAYRSILESGALR